MNEIICGDSLEVMRQLPSGYFDLVLTSPPYNLRNSTGNGFKKQWTNTKIWKNAGLGKGYDSHDDNMPHDEYASWQRECLTEMMRLIKDNGAIFYNHKWRVQGGLIQDRQDIVSDFPVRQIIIWQRSGGMNFNPSYFVPTYEVIYLIAKPNFKLAPKANKYGDVWKIKQEVGNPHPAPFPLELAEKVVSCTTGLNILDPFIGSGTTAIAAKKLNKNCVGIDHSQEYCDLATTKLKGLDPVANEAMVSLFG